ncbi:HotDog domain-containing protein [Lentinula raphanica]|nr:HotDog domain-containing protein [Lentinula raphanica]
MSEDISHIGGNASDKIKSFLVDRRKLFKATGLNPKLETTFGDSVVAGLRLSEITIHQNAVEPLSLEARVVCKTYITQDMVNGHGTLHGGCSALLIDFCSSLATIALQIHTTGFPGLGFSETIHVVFHAPALLGETLRIVNTTMAVGRRVASARTEIWSETHHRLVASGVHIKMEPSSTKL